jgi:hypothetical protein
MPNKPVKSPFRRDPRPVEVIGRQPGEADRSSLVRAVLVRASRCWHGFAMTAAGLRALRVPRRALFENRTLLRHAKAPDADKPRQRRAWPNIDRQREDLYIYSFHPARDTPPHDAVTERTDSGR